MQLDRRRQVFWTFSGERSTARQCRGYGPCPSRSAAGYCIYIYTASPLPVRKQNSAAQHFYAAVERAPLSMRRFRVIMPITQGLPQRNESFECSQKDGHRRYGPRAVREVQPDSGALEHEQEVARKSGRGVSTNLDNMRNPSTRRTLF